MPQAEEYQGQPLDQMQPAIPPEIAQQEALNNLLPSREGFTENVAERAGEILPGMLFGGSGPQEILTRTLLGALSGETAKKYGAGNIGQTLAEAVPLAAPNIMNPRLNPNASQREFVEFARRQGLTEQQIAPLLQEDTFATNVLSKFSPKGGRTRRALDSSRRGVNQSWENLRNRPEASTVLPQDVQDRLFRSLYNDLNQIPAEVRNRIRQDLFDFMNSNRSMSDLTNLWGDINSQFSGQGNRLQILKGGILDALESVNPQFARDFELTNELSQRFRNINQRLRPSMVSQIAEGISIAKAPIQLGIGLLTGNATVLLELLGEVGGRNLARELLINPRAQNLSRKTLQAINENKLQLARTSWNSLKRELRKAGVEQETIDQLQDIDIDEFLSSIRPKKKEKTSEEE